VVEILINEQCQHVLRLRSSGVLGSTQPEPLTQFSWVGIAFDLTPNLPADLGLLTEILYDFSGIPQVIGQDRVDISKPEGRKILLNLFCCGAGVEEDIRSNRGSHATVPRGRHRSRHASSPAEFRGSDVAGRVSA
jgi:hypothetical protein